MIGWFITCSERWVSCRATRKQRQQKGGGGEQGVTFFSCRLSHFFPTNQTPETRYLARWHPRCAQPIIPLCEICKLLPLIQYRYSLEVLGDVVKCLQGNSLSCIWNKILFLSNFRRSLLSKHSLIRSTFVTEQSVIRWLTGEPSLFHVTDLYNVTPSKQYM